MRRRHLPALAVALSLTLVLAGWRMSAHRSSPAVIHAALLLPVFVGLVARAGRVTRTTERR